jgi:hypothetical protein
VLAFRYGSVLLEVLGGVLGSAGELHDAFSVEVQHLMAVPQVRRKTSRNVLLEAGVYSQQSMQCCLACGVCAQFPCTPEGHLMAFPQARCREQRHVANRACRCLNKPWHRVCMHFLDCTKCWAPAGAVLGYCCTATCC